MEREPIIGIGFSTTDSEVAILDGGQPHVHSGERPGHPSVAGRAGKRRPAAGGRRLRRA